MSVGLEHELRERSNSPGPKRHVYLRTGKEPRGDGDGFYLAMSSESERFALSSLTSISLRWARLAIT